MSAAEGYFPWRKALVVFSGQTDLWWLRLFKPGFRHCFVALQSDLGWLTYEPLSHRTELVFPSIPADFDLADWYRRHGLTVVETTLRTPSPRCAPWRFYSCVEAVKRVLGIRAAGVLTPWQLYHFLMKDIDSKSSVGI